MNTESGALREKPLSGSAKLALFCGAGAVILLSYLFCTAAVLFVLALIACEFVALIVLARFGMARAMGRVMAAHIPVLTIFFRSFWLRKPAEYRTDLQPSDAPELFAMLKTLCEKAQVEVPREVQIEMSVNAWVHLRGYRRGAGRTVLGIGYDLLAGLSKWEIEGVLAHEITHAKLVQRGYKSWLNRGLGRMRQLAQGLYTYFEAHRKTNKSVDLAEYLFHITDKLTRSAARLVAGCSRQDEFDADRGAAALCGAGAIRSSLLKTEPLAKHAARLRWNERVARLQSGEGFGQWLAGELASADFKRGEEAENKLFFKYSTHPSLADRLAALPEDANDAKAESVPGITLLNDPDKVAETLISAIQKTAAEEEQKDSKRLRRLTRRGGMRSNLRPVQAFGVFLLLGGVIGGGITAIVNGISLGLLCFVAGAVGVGVLCFRLGRYRDRLTLPVPDFAVLKSAWQNPPKATDKQLKAMENEIEARASGELELAKLCYEALGRCDYVRAHIASRICLQVNRKSIEGAVGLAVAGAAFRQTQQVQKALHYLQRATGMTSPGVALGAGWALLLCGDWAPAEAFLEIASKSKNPTLLLLLALCQSNRGKLQSALLTARQACSPRPLNDEHAKFLIDLLLQAGYLREARERLKLLAPRAADDIELMLLWVRLNLLRREFAAADHWTEQLRSKQCGPHYFVWLGRFHEAARQNQKAANFYNEALAAGFYPESLLGLARLEAQERNKEQAKKYLIEALNTGRALGERAVGPLPLFNHITSQLLSLEEPVQNCRAWIASLNGGKSPPGLANRSLLIYASGRQQAEEFLHELVCAMQPGTPPLIPSSIGWKEAEKEKQPDGPVRAGIQCVLN